MGFLSSKESASTQSRREEYNTIPARTAQKDPSTELNAFLGRGCEYEGKLTFEGTVRIDGRFTGEIFSNDVLIIGQGAEVHAEIDVAVVIVSGNVVGNITARTRVELHAPARLVGNLVTPVLTVDEGVFFEGNCRMDVAAYQKSREGRAGSKPAPSDNDMDTFDLSKYDTHA
ncbi:MAG: polymer-forming cytoskeletal protein [Myxococcota bacterium]